MSLGVDTDVVWCRLLQAPSIVFPKDAKAVGEHFSVEEVVVGHLLSELVQKALGRPDALSSRAWRAKLGPAELQEMLWNDLSLHVSEPAAAEAVLKAAGQLGAKVAQRASAEELKEPEPEVSADPLIKAASASPGPSAGPSAATLVELFAWANGPRPQQEGLQAGCLEVWAGLNRLNCDDFKKEKEAVGQAEAGEHAAETDVLIEMPGAELPPAALPLAVPLYALQLPAEMGGRRQVHDQCGEVERLARLFEAARHSALHATATFRTVQPAGPPAGQSHELETAFKRSFKRSLCRCMNATAAAQEFAAPSREEVRLLADTGHWRAWTTRRGHGDRADVRADVTADDVEAVRGRWATGGMTGGGRLAGWGPCGVLLSPEMVVVDKLEVIEADAGTPDSVGGSTVVDYTLNVMTSAAPTVLASYEEVGEQLRAERMVERTRAEQSARLGPGREAGMAAQLAFEVKLSEDAAAAKVRGMSAMTRAVPPEVGWAMAFSPGEATTLRIFLGALFGVSGISLPDYVDGASEAGPPTSLSRPNALSWKEDGGAKAVGLVQRVLLLVFCTLWLPPLVEAVEQESAAAAFAAVGFGGVCVVSFCSVAYQLDHHGKELMLWLRPQTGVAAGQLCPIPVQICVHSLLIGLIWAVRGLTLVHHCPSVCPRP